jgi:N-methylhydantoinase B
LLDRAFQELMSTYGKDQVIQATRQSMDYTERMLRREIAKIPTATMSPKGFLTMTAVTVASRCR